MGWRGLTGFIFYCFILGLIAAFSCPIVYEKHQVSQKRVHSSTVFLPGVNLTWWLIWRYGANMTIYLPRLPKTIFLSVSRTWIRSWQNSDSQAHPHSQIDTVNPVSCPSIMSRRSMIMCLGPFIISFYFLSGGPSVCLQVKIDFNCFVWYLWCCIHFHSDSTDTNWSVLGNG